jgi:hypothetical protein
MLISNEGSYRGEILEGGLSESTNGFPQEVLKLKSVEVWDTESQEWLPADPENNEIVWYGVLFDGKDKETLNCKQLKKVTGWAGASFAELDALDLAGVPIQFRVEPHTYNENTTLQVSWIDVHDAVPGKTLRKLDKEGVVALQQRYATILASTKTAVKAVSAPVSAAPAPKTAPKATASKATNPAVPKTTPKPKGRPTVPAAKPSGKCTPDEAWDAVMALKKDDITEEAMTGIWTDEVYKINPDPDALTPEQWFAVKVSVQKLTSKV